MEILKEILNLIVSAIAAISVLYNTYFKKSDVRARKYYEEILCPFIEKYSLETNQHSPNKEAIKWVKSRVKRSDETVPKYVTYVLEHKSINDAEKVLLADYYSLYDNKGNRFCNNLGKFQTLLSQISLLCSIVLIIMACTLFSVKIVTYITYIINSLDRISNTITSIANSFPKCIINELKDYGLILLLYLAGINLSKLFLYSDTDMYSLNIRKIEKLIDRKIKEYDQKNMDYFF